MRVQCPACHNVFDTREAESLARVEQATSAPGELRTVIRPPAIMPAEPPYEDEEPNPGGSDDYC